MTSTPMLLAVSLCWLARSAAYQLPGTEMVPRHYLPTITSPGFVRRRTLGCAGAAGWASAPEPALPHVCASARPPALARPGALSR